MQPLSIIANEIFGVWVRLLSSVHNYVFFIVVLKSSFIVRSSNEDPISLFSLSLSLSLSFPLSLSLSPPFTFSLFFSLRFCSAPPSHFHALSFLLSYFFSPLLTFHWFAQKSYKTRTMRARFALSLTLSFFSLPFLLSFFPKHPISSSLSTLPSLSTYQWTLTLHPK